MKKRIKLIFNEIREDSIKLVRKIERDPKLFKITKIVMVSILLGILLIGGLFLFKNNSISYNELVQHIQNREVQSITISSSKEYLRVKLNNGEECFLINPNTDKSNDFIYESGVEIRKQRDYTRSSLTFVMMMFSSILIFVFIKFVTGDGKFKPSFGISSKLDTSSKTSSVLFKDIAGNEESKEQMQDLVTYLKEPEKFKEYGVKPPKGVIFYGPPGTGKTLLAKALAGEASCDFISVNGADFVDKYVGNGASRVRELFEEARRKMPCIIFIDEIDAIGGERTSSSHEERNQTLNSLLGEIDGFNDDEGIIIIAATNRLETLDKALLRSGRFDTKIQVALPDINAREQIFKVHSKNKPVSETIDFKYFAKITTYFSGADIENIMNKAGLYAIKDNSDFIKAVHINKAINVHIAGDEKKDRRSILEKDKYLTAVHEVGHALVAKKFANVEVSKITIIPTTSGAGGYTLLNEEEVSYKSKDDLFKRIAVSVGGRAAEEVMFGKDNVTTGAASDIKNATGIVENMIKVYGMSDRFGMMNLERYRELEGVIVEEGKEIIEGIYGDVVKFLEENKTLLEGISDRLVECENMDESEFNKLVDENN